MNITSNYLTKDMLDTLDKHFANKVIMDIDRTSFLVCNLKDLARKITISLVFLRDWDSLDTDDFNVVIIKPYGAVFTFPAYWESIPKELCMPFFTRILDEFYTNEVSTWGLDDGTGTGNNNGNSDSSSGNNKDCNCNCPVVQQAVLI